MVMRTQREIRQRAPLWLTGLLVLNLALMAFSAHQSGDISRPRVLQVWVQALFAPVQSAMTGAGGAGVGFFQHIADLRHAASENEGLKRRVADMETELRDARAVRDENERLKRLLAFKDESEYKPLPARVIARDPSEWWNTVLVNRGSASGVGLNMPVVTPDGVVGRVIGVSPWTAQVLLLTDERAAAGAVVGQLGASNALGAVRGMGRNGLLEMRYVPGLEPVKVGDYVLTTGQDGIYPQGLNVGEVVEFKQGSATQPHDIKVKPSARLNALEEVAVLLYHPPPRTAPTETLPNMDKGKKQ
ncbi:MAG TPA: rod shape-determining protein MreC [Pyrinomonadaceae bacterium]|jgi:rod shape-determining protein MreC